jgi:hypothetical protein
MLPSVTWPDVVDLVNRIGIIGILLFVIWAAATKKWVWGWQLEDANARIEAANARAEKLQEVLDAALRNQERALDLIERRGVPMANLGIQSQGTPTNP